MIIKYILHSVSTEGSALSSKLHIPQLQADQLFVIKVFLAVLGCRCRPLLCHHSLPLSSSLFCHHSLPLSLSPSSVIVPLPVVFPSSVTVPLICRRPWPCSVIISLLGHRPPALSSFPSSITESPVCFVSLGLSHPVFGFPVSSSLLGQQSMPCVRTYQWRWEAMINALTFLCVCLWVGGSLSRCTIACYRVSLPKWPPLAVYYHCQNDHYLL